jgi:hypothetical protein
MNIRQILSYLVSTFVPEDTFCLVKELIHNKILGTTFDDPDMDLKTIIEKDDMIPKYSGWNLHIAPRGPFVFQIITHTKPTLHCFPSKDK